MSKKNKIFHKKDSKIPSQEDIFEYLTPTDGTIDKSANPPLAASPSPSFSEISKKRESSDESISRSSSSNRKKEKLSSSKEYEFEKAMLADPLLYDAVEGYEHIKDKHKAQNAVAEINSFIHKRVEAKQNNKMFLRIAASLLLLLFMGSTGYFLTTKMTYYKVVSSESNSEGIAVDQPIVATDSVQNPQNLAQSENTQLEEKNNLNQKDKPFIVPNNEKEENNVPLLTYPASNEIQGGTITTLPASPNDEEEKSDTTIITNQLAFDLTEDNRDKVQQIVEYKSAKNKSEVRKKNMAPRYTDVRSSESTTKEIPSKTLKECIELYHNKEYSEANTNLELFLLKNSKNQEALFYKGMSEYHLTIFNKAVESLKLVSKDSRHYDEANWYTALSYEMLGMKTEAKELLQKLSRYNNAYQENAVLKLKELEKQ